MVQRYSEALQAAGELGFAGVQSQETDPPDCLAITNGGARVAVEVTELVDEDMVRTAQRLPGRFRDWAPRDVIAKLQQIIDNKDLKCGGLAHYDRVLLLVHTDEVFIHGYSGDAVRDAVGAHVFRAPRHIHEVVLLVSYDPRVQTYPFTRLQLAPATEAG